MGRKLRNGTTVFRTGFGNIKVLYDPLGDFTGKTFSRLEVIAMLGNLALADGTVIEIDGKRWHVFETVNEMGVQVCAIRQARGGKVVYPHIAYGGFYTIDAPTQMPLFAAEEVVA